MKALQLFLVFFFSLTAVIAQEDMISRHFGEYEKDQSIEKINLDRTTFERFATIKTEDPGELRLIQAFQELNGVKAIFLEHDPTAHALGKEAVRTVMGDESYEELMSINTKQENVLMTIREEEDVVKELSIVVGADQNFMVATLYGKIDLKTFSTITTVLRKNGKEWFKQFQNIATEELSFGPSVATGKVPKATWDDDLGIRIFPNPASSYIRLEAQKTNDETYKVEFYSLVGERLQVAQNVSLPHQINLSDLPAGTFVVRLTAPDGRFKNYRILKSNNRP